jgi:oxalate decarboxylase/phosphoglucose isomerase-like protein (cupin superfamily)
MAKPAAARSGTPEQVVIPIREPFVDERGEIRNLLDAPLSSVAVITSVKGAVRGNHYHRTDSHYCWLQEGEMVYLHRPAGHAGAAGRWTIKAGQMFYTPPQYEHAMHFTRDSVLFVFARNNRDMANYEADTVRTGPLA